MKFYHRIHNHIFKFVGPMGLTAFEAKSHITVNHSISDVKLPSLYCNYIVFNICTL